MERSPLNGEGNIYSMTMDKKVAFRSEYSAPECRVREIPLSISFLQSIGDWKEDPEELN